MGDVLRIRSGYAFKSATFSKEGVPLVRQADLAGNAVDLSACVHLPDRYLREYERFSLKTGDILIGMSGSIGKLCIYDKPFPALQNQRTGKIEWISRSELDVRYIWHFLKTIGPELSERGKGVAVANVSAGDIESVSLPLAPLGEQKRIADKLDSLLARVDASRARLNRVPHILKRFREAVLEAGVSGRLTEEWRGAREEQSENVSNFGGLEEGSFRGYSIPRSWGTARLSEIADVAGGITKDSKKQSDAGEDIPYLRVANVQRGYLDLGEVKTIRVPTDRIETLLLRTGDVLFNEGGDIDKLGRGWVWEGQIERCVLQNHVFRARLHDATFSPRFFSHFGNSRALDYFLSKGKQTTNLASINKSVLSSLPVPVPGAAEQREIVRRVDELFAVAASLERRYGDALKRVEKLTPSIQAKAFQGKLVPQDPKDEPAERLLERIRAARASEDRFGLAGRGPGRRARKDQSVKSGKAKGGRRLRTS